MAIQMRRGALADLDPTKLLPGEFAISTTGEPMVCRKAGDVVKMLTDKDQADLEALLLQLTELKSSIDTLLVQKVGINDAEATLTEAYSGSKTQTLLNAKAAQTAVDILNQSLANIGGITTSVANTVACKHITTTQISSISLSGGTYLIIGSCLFPYAAGGYGDRRVLITESLTEGVTQENTNAVSANNNSYSTIIEKSRLVYVDRGTTKIFLLCAFQASGADMDVSGRMRIVRLA